MSELATASIQALAEEYERLEPFAAVETERLETLPIAIRNGTLQWKDVEWMVRWYYRRHRSSRYNDRRKRAEKAFRDNEWAEIIEVLESAIDIEEPTQRLAQVATLSGIDHQIATGVLYYLNPTDDIVMGEREWQALETVDEIEDPYPAAVSTRTYREYRSRCLGLTRRFNVTLIEVQRALWRLTAIGE